MKKNSKYLKVEYMGWNWLTPSGFNELEHEQQTMQNRAIEHPKKKWKKIKNSKNLNLDYEGCNLATLLICAEVEWEQHTKNRKIKFKIPEAGLHGCNLVTLLIWDKVQYEHHALQNRTGEHERRNVRRKKYKGIPNGGRHGLLFLIGLNTNRRP
jgi:hypothetical protein